MSKATLTFFCGKMGAGKSTRARVIAQQSNAVLLVEDEWLASLYPGKISSLEDYITLSELMKPQMKKLAQSILSAGSHVVMDFPANTLVQRQWFRSIFTEVGVLHNLVFIDLSDEACLKQIAKRRQEEPNRVATDTPEMFHQVTQYFTAPVVEEGFNITQLNEHG